MNDKKENKCDSPTSTTSWPERSERSDRREGGGEQPTSAPSAATAWYSNGTLGCSSNSRTPRRPGNLENLLLRTQQCPTAPPRSGNQSSSTPADTEQSRHGDENSPTSGQQPRSSPETTITAQQHACSYAAALTKRNQAADSATKSTSTAQPHTRAVPTAQNACPDCEEPRPSSADSASGQARQGRAQERVTECTPLSPIT